MALGDYLDSPTNRPLGMNILHALLVVKALPFHLGPFAFAYPLAAIDYYDGYVNTTSTQNRIDGALMKDVLGSIVETCQTITTQNHGDSALMKRVPGDIIETRQGLPVVIPVVGLIFVIVVTVFGSIIWIAEDDRVRGNDVELLVEHFD